MTNLTLVSMDDLHVLLSEKAIKNEILDISQAAEYLKVTETTTRKQAELGLVPGRKIGREWRFSSIALYEYVAKKEVIK